jgi:hypothetical protein
LLMKFLCVLFGMIACWISETVEKVCLAQLSSSTASWGDSGTRPRSMAGGHAMGLCIGSYQRDLCQDPKGAGWGSSGNPMRPDDVGISWIFLTFYMFTNITTFRKSDKLLHNLHTGSGLKNYTILHIIKSKIFRSPRLAV